MVTFAYNFLWRHLYPLLTSQGLIRCGGSSKVRILRGHFDDCGLISSNNYSTFKDRNYFDFHHFGMVLFATCHKWCRLQDCFKDRHPNAFGRPWISLEHFRLKIDFVLRLFSTESRVKTRCWVWGFIDYILL